jgi:hypothetical protein
MFILFKFLEIMATEKQTLELLFNFTFTPTSVCIYGVAFIDKDNLIFKDPGLLIKVICYWLDDQGSMPSRVKPYIIPPHVLMAWCLIRGAATFIYIYIHTDTLTLHLLRERRRLIVI